MYILMVRLKVKKEKINEFIKESIKDDPIVIKAKEILQDPIAYKISFIPDQETETISN